MASLIPAAIDALYALWTTTFDADPMQVIDGEPVNYVSGRYLGVGLDTAADEDADGLSELSGLGSRRTETATIACAIWVASGDTAMKPHRDAAFAALDLARAALAIDRRLGGVCTRADIAGFGYRPQRSGRGAGVAIPFTVDVTRL